MNQLDPVELARRLIEFDTCNPPGHEAACARFIAAMLAGAGFDVTEHAFGRGRVSIVARKGSASARKALCFVGHLDTVPVGAASWRFPPHAATLDGGRLHGRGSCDMKSGVAALLCAAMRAGEQLGPNASLTLLLPGGEETGCEGSSHLVASGVDLEGFDGVIVAEPTDLKPLLGHKGALWLRVRAKGVAAHGAMPQNGVNAAVKAARMVLKLQDFCDAFESHPVLGRPTLNVGRVNAGHTINIVPDLAEIDIDLRTTPAMEHEDLRRRVTEALAPDIHDSSVLITMNSVFTEPQQPWVQSVFAIAERETKRPAARETASYFTDASALVPALGGAPVLILGPGEPRLMHQTDESCEIAQIVQAERIYSAIIAQTLGPAAASARVAEAA
jgi:succinyl-diaminopimelate desuccinylase